jgi:hypothetical protein
MNEGITMCYPNGDMCMNCTKLYEKCNHLPFEEMRKHKQDGVDYIVICSDYVKRG